MFDFIMYSDDTTLSSTLKYLNDNTLNKNKQSLINGEFFKVNNG